MEFHISGDLRKKLDLEDLLFSYTGNIVFGNVAASRNLAKQLEELRKQQTGQPGVVNAGALFAMGLIDELNHAMIARYREEIDPAVFADAVRWFTGHAKPEEIQRLLLKFTEQFPNVAIHRGEQTAAEWLNGTTDGQPNREAALEELLLLWLANINPGFSPFRELFEDTPLKQQTIYQTVTAGFPDYFVTRPPLSEAGTLLDALRAPLLASPDSLTGQLDYIREYWSKYLGEDLRRVLLAIDVLREEDLAIWLRFHPPGPDQYRHGAPGRGGEGFVGDEYIGFEDEYINGPDGRQRRYGHDYQAPLNEYEAFSADQAWMPTVVLMAKSTYVWLEQLSKKHLRHIHRLDQIPDEELHLLADRGITGLWLIGLWERSVASRTIKRLRGHHDAVASAYSLKEYQIAEDLGGNHAYENLRDRAARAGIRLASDMVPNHMGIDSNWVIENPDWFLYRWESPFPVYRFEGPDLSTDSRVEIKIEDHYYDQSDAAVVFRLRHHRDGATRYMYHGNDGTTFAWNDTAQLDYSKAAVREHVIQVILHVARLFPIIRFDAAMVLAKRHVQRLWFPLPGTGGSIPSRAENAMPQDEFEALMPHEFWREVVDRVAAEVPGTLLLAEAFWLLEGYFVRTLGMHRVYNSAFMNMLRDEENAKYRSYLKKTIEFDPDILKRYVSFMSNPDERTAIDQFGTGDKYFGVCTLLATLPGLPMFGHGQIEGYTERYGMEFKQAKMEEWPKENLVSRHQHEIAPLLKNRRLFAESTNFVLYDFWTDFGSVDENVFAYSNRAHGERAIILYNNSYGSTHGTIHFSAASIDKATGHLRQRSLSDGLDLPYNYFTFFAYRDTAHGLEYLCRSTDLHHTGLSIDLRGYQYAVLLNWRELRATVDQPWDQLFDALNGAGVYSVEEALSKLRLRPLHEAFRQALSENHIRAFTSVASELANKGAASTTTKLAASNGNDKTATAAPATKAQQPTASVQAPAGDTPLPPSEQLPLHPRLQPFVKCSQRFFEKVLQNLPSEADEFTSQSNDATEAISNYKNLCETMTKAALHLISISRNFSTTLPPAASRFLPGAKTTVPTEQIWAPVLTWITLHSLPRQDDQAALFDKLQLRSALSETFTAIGIEGENTWRAAARVRILLSQTDTSPTKSEQFWSDPDVRWLTGINESSGVTYFNKEGFEELLGWLQLPALINLAQQSPINLDSIKTLEAAVLESCKSAQTAGYNLDRYLHPEPLKVPATQVASHPKPTPAPASEAKPAPKKPKKPAPTTR
ncbi:alpha-amylase family glycosyl hydrolase [Tunturibacter psychrotolerans]|uniref:Alpha-amylase family glycosyl hydrolase n=1 Tax=Tunturiibacter psychrotolerans TaxID=3069686 RepID=A0AAU7ZX14_9BACT